MKEFRATSIVLAALLALSACSTSNPVVFNTTDTTSSGSGSSDSSSSNGLVYTKDSIPSDATTVSGTYVQADSSSGEIGDVTDTSHAISGSTAVTSDAYTIALADGTTYTSIYSYQDKLLKESVAAGDDIYVLDRWSYYGIIKYLGINLGSALWGLVYQGSGGTVHITSDIAVAFAQGFATDASVIDVLTGTATYSGRALIAGTGFDLSDAKSVEADSSFTVDFGDKTLTGTITPSSNSTTSFATINLAATISGNSFNGEVDGTTTSGQFYGTNGNELAGTFANAEAGYYGAYGAIKGEEGDGSSTGDGTSETETSNVSQGYTVFYNSASVDTKVAITESEELSSTENSFRALTGISVSPMNTGFYYYTNTNDGKTYTTTDTSSSECAVYSCSAVTNFIKIYDLYDVLTDSKASSKLTLYDAGYLYFNNKTSSKLGSTVDGFNLKYGQWGVRNIAAYAFGDVTPEDSMPTTGTATYTGLAATYTGYSSLTGASTSVIPSTASFSVDFDSKSLTGTITAMDSSIDAIDLGAKITGNSFVGTKDGYVTEGVFLGSKAEEMSGVYTNSDTLVSGAFGAAKQ